MTDYDADEVVPQKKHLERTPLIDKALGATGIALAALASFFPWYAFLHQDKFSMPNLWQGSTRDAPAKAGHASVPGSQTAMINADDQATAAVDDLTTATVPGENLPKTDLNDNEEQPFPSASGFKLVHVANGRALIEDNRGMYLVRIGSALPDNSRLATLEQRDGSWVMITSKGDIYKTN